MEEMFFNKFIDCGATGWFSAYEAVTDDVVVGAEMRVVLPVQTHTTNVAVVVDGTEDLTDTDAVITRAPGLTVGVRTADCVPIILYAPDIQAVAAVHAGWRGTIGGIVDNTVEQLVSMGARVSRIRAAFGPSICGACYEVDIELGERFVDAGFGECVSYHAGSEKPHLDLQAVNVMRLKGLGVVDENIMTSRYCTRHSRTKDGRPLFPSWRRTPGISERLITCVALPETI